MTQVLQVAVAVSAIIGAVWGIGKLVAVLWRGFRRAGWFLDAALGEPAQGSTPARPGMLDRLAAIEEKLTLIDGLEARLTALEARFPAEIPLAATRE